MVYIFDGGGRNLARILATCFLVDEAKSWGILVSDFSTDEMKLDSGMVEGAGTKN